MTFPGCYLVTPLKLEYVYIVDVIVACFVFINDKNTNADTL